jgi:hypothetical protein
MGLTVDIEVRERVAAYFIAQMEQASPARREKLIRLLIQCLPRHVIDGMWISCALLAEIRDEETEREHEA